MTVHGVSCLFCRTDLEIAEKTKSNKKKARVLRHIHKRLFSAMKLDFPLKFRKWDFSNEPFPFCPSCQKVILRLIRLMDQLKGLELEISHCVSTLSMLTMVADQEDNGSKEESTKKLLERKYQYFRDVIIQRFNTKVRIEKISDHTPHFLDADTASPKTDSQPEAAEVCNPHVVIATDIDYDDLEDDICFVSSPIPPEPGSPSESETWDYCPSPVDSDYIPDDDPLSNPTECNNNSDSSEILDNSVLSEPSPISDSGEGADCANDEVSPAKRPRQQQSYNSEEETLEETCDLDIKVRPLADQRGRKSKRVPKIYRVEQLGKGLYNLNGFGFKEIKKGYECSTCEQIFPFPPGWRGKMKKTNVKWRNIKTHIEKIHISPSRAVYPIKVVDKDKKIYRTIGHEFQELENGFQCSTCKKICSFAPERFNHRKWANIKNHIISAHGPGQQDLKRCKICNAEVKHLSIHMKGVHCDESDTRVCELCGKEFKSLISLFSHKTMVHRRPQLGRRFECDDCGKTFPHKITLQLHQRIHAGVKPFICEHCGKAFRFEHVLKTHVASAHGERKFACDQCDWKFGVKFLLTRHVKQVHEGVKPPRPKKRKKVQEPREESEKETFEAGDLAPSAGEEEP